MSRRIETIAALIQDMEALVAEPKPMPPRVHNPWLLFALLMVNLAAWVLILWGISACVTSFD